MTQKKVKCNGGLKRKRHQDSILTPYSTVKQEFTKYILLQPIVHKLLRGLIVAVIFIAKIVELFDLVCR